MALYTIKGQTHSAGERTIAMLINRGTHLVILSLILLAWFGSTAQAEQLIWASPKITYPELWKQDLTVDTSCTTWFETPGVKTCSEWKPVWSGIHSNLECIGYVETGGFKTCVGWDFDASWKVRKAMWHMEIYAPETVSEAILNAVKNLAAVCGGIAFSAGQAAYYATEAETSGFDGTVLAMKAFIKVAWETGLSCMETGAYGAFTNEVILAAAGFRWSMVEDHEWVTITGDPSSAPETRVIQEVSTQEELDARIRQIEELDAEVAALTVTLPTDEQIDLEEIWVNAINEIYQDVWHREPSVSELGRARLIFANGGTYEQVEAKVKAERNGILMMIEQYVTLR